MYVEDCSTIQLCTNMRKLPWYDFVRWPSEQREKYLVLVDAKNQATLYDKGNKEDEKKYKTALAKVKK